MTRTARSAVLGVLVLALGGCDDLLMPGSCLVERDVEATLGVDGLDRVEILAGAGDLEVIGSGSLDRVEVRGRACAADRRTLDEVGVEVSSVGSEGRIRAVLPGASDGRALLDLVIRVPSSLVYRVVHGSGDVEVRGVRGIEVVDGSGDIRIEDISRWAAVDDGSGELYIRDVRGHVDIEDESGHIQVYDVWGHVTIPVDGSGDIIVDGVGGDFWLGRDGTGRVDVRNVAGTIYLP